MSVVVLLAVEVAVERVESPASRRVVGAARAQVPS